MSPADTPLKVGQHPEKAGLGVRQARPDWFEYIQCEGCKTQMPNRDLVRRDKHNGYWNHVTCPICGSDEIEDVAPCDWCGDLFTSLDDDGLCFACGPAPEAV